MKEEILFTVDVPYRRALPVRGFRFGSPEKKSLAVMGALRGNELQQMYIAARLVQSLKRLEAEGALAADCGVLVVPCANQFSMNVGRRFWAADNTDINRMFPGYEQGETTQRIAARLFAALQGFTWGVHLASFHLPGDHPPHVRLMKTGYEMPEDALGFGLPYVLLREPRAYDTTTLNFNWQIWNTRAFSLYTHSADPLDPEAAREAVEAILRFLRGKGLLLRDAAPAGFEPVTFEESALRSVLTAKGGVLLRKRKAGDLVKEGDELAELLEPCTGELEDTLRAVCDGRIFFACKAQLLTGHDVAFRILPASYL